MADEQIKTTMRGRPVRRSFTTEELMAPQGNWAEEYDEVLTLPDGRQVVDAGPPDPVADPSGEDWYEYDPKTGLPMMDRPVAQTDIDNYYRARRSGGRG